MGHSGISSTTTALPPALAAGDRVGVAALSGPAPLQELDAGLDQLRSLGFEPVAADNLRSRQGLFAGSDQARLDGFHLLAADPEIKAIFFARGGHGVLRLLSGIEWDLLARHPRAYIGYSDLTPFLLEVTRRLGLATFHGPMVAKDFARGLEDQEIGALLAALSGELPYSIEVKSRGSAGVVEGPLLGGCLSLLTSLLGTAFEPRLEGSILFWEDVDEPLYRLDRMLIHLHLSGRLSSVAGMVVGRFASSSESIRGFGLGDLFTELTRRESRPLVIDCPSGHCQPNLTLPLGMKARIDPAAETLLVGLSSD